MIHSGKSGNDGAKDLKAIVLVILGLMLAASLTAPPCCAQDLEAQVRQHQEEVRRRIEEGRARIQRDRAEMERRYSSFPGSNSGASSAKTYVQNYNVQPPGSPGAYSTRAARNGQRPDLTSKGAAGRRQTQ